MILLTDLIKVGHDH